MKKGFKTITVEVEFYKEWRQVKEEYVIKRGIRSFSAYITYRLAQLINEDNNQRSRISKSTTLNKP
jgi:predicted CopG family antitoxin